LILSTSNGLGVGLVVYPFFLLVAGIAIVVLILKILNLKKKGITLVRIEFINIYLLLIFQLCAMHFSTLDSYTPRFFYRDILDSLYSTRSINPESDPSWIFLLFLIFFLLTLFYTIIKLRGESNTKQTAPSLRPLPPELSNPI